MSAPNTETSSSETFTPETGGGFSLGQTATDLITCYGGTPVAQRSGSAQAAVTTTAATTTSPWGFSTLAQANAVVTLLNELRAALVNINMIKGS